MLSESFHRAALRLPLEFVGVVAIVPAIPVRLIADASEVLSLLIPAPEPRELVLVPHGFLPPILFPLDLDALSQDVRSGEGSDVHPHAVVDIGVPAYGLLGKRLPADEEVIRSLAR